MSAFLSQQLSCSAIVDRDWLFDIGIRIIFNTVNITNKVYHKVCRISYYIRKTFMNIVSALKQFYISMKNIVCCCRL